MGSQIESLGSELEEQVRSSRQHATAEAEKIKERLDHQLTTLRQNLEASMQGATQDIDAVLRNTVRKSDVDHLLRSKADRAELQHAVDRQYSEIDGLKAEIAELRSQLQQSKLHAQELEDALAKKAEIADLNPLLETKANVDDVNRSLVSVAQELDTKATVQSLAVALKEQASINSTVYSELCLGRWVWKGGATRAGGVIPWSTQSVNTDPSNLVWSKDRMSLEVVLAGLYEVSFGFYSQCKPSVTVLVNGEAVMCVSSSNSVKGGNSRVVVVPKHSAGIIAGLTHTDFIALPAKARVALVYQGDDKAEAFVGLRKM
jgi:hypothetical protein